MIEFYYSENNNYDFKSNLFLLFIPAPDENKSLPYITIEWSGVNFSWGPKLAKLKELLPICSSTSNPNSGGPYACIGKFYLS